MSYVDYRAVEQARPGIPSPESWEAWQALSESPPGELWSANRYRIASGSADFYELFAFFDTDAIEKYGFDYFDIDRSFSFGRPPQKGTILGGDLDLDTIAAAHAARTYTENDLNGVPVWCGPVGCENGHYTNLRQREVYPIFGSRLGRQEPLALIPGYILNSPSWPVIESMVRAYQDTQDSLLDLPAYRAVAEMLTADEGLLIQVQFLHPFSAGFSEDTTSVLSDTVADYGPLPPYELAVLADRQEGEDQVNIMALVHSNEAAATQAANELTQRIATYPDLYHSEQSFIIEHEAIMDAPRLYHSQTADRWVAVGAARYPLPGNEKVGGFYQSPGLLFIRWYRGYLERLLVPLWIEFE
jgi:hypothetical protein